MELPGVIGWRSEAVMTSDAGQFQTLDDARQYLQQLGYLKLVHC